jgi:hypothetical protein
MDSFNQIIAILLTYGAILLIGIPISSVFFALVLKPMETKELLVETLFWPITLPYAAIWVIRARLFH